MLNLVLIVLMKVLDYILVVQKTSLVVGFGSILGLLGLFSFINPVSNNLWFLVLFIVLFLFTTSFLILSSFFWSFTIQQTMLSILQVNILIARASSLSIAFVAYLAAVLTQQTNFYLNLFFVSFLVLYLVYSYNLD